jgi:hypothetical protein
MSSKKELIAVALPPRNFVTPIGPGVYRASYINEGKARVTMELVAVGLRRDEGKPVFALLATGEEMTAEQLDAYLRERWPMEKEIGRNPANVTLGVQNGVMGGTAK